MSIVLAVALYKQHEIKISAKDIEMVNVEIVDIYCSNRPSKRNYSYVKFKYNAKIHRQDVSGTKCKSISAKTNFNLYYVSKTDSFYLPELFEDNYLQKPIIFLICMVTLGLIPYKLLIK